MLYIVYKIKERNDIVSSYFTVHTKGEKPIELIVYPTSLARELADLLYFEYDKEVELTNELLKSFIVEVDSERKDCFSSIENAEKQIKELQETLPKAQNPEIYSCIKEDISSLADQITYLKSEADKYQEVINDFRFLLQLLENNDNLELYYCFA